MTARYLACPECGCTDLQVCERVWHQAVHEDCGSFLTLLPGEQTGTDEEWGRDRDVACDRCGWTGAVRSLDVTSTESPEPQPDAT